MDVSYTVCWTATFRVAMPAGRRRTRQASGLRSTGMLAVRRDVQHQGSNTSIRRLSTLLCDFCTLLCRFCTLLSRLSTSICRSSTLLCRSSTPLRRFCTLLCRSNTLLCRLSTLILWTNTSRAGLKPAPTDPRDVQHQGVGGVHGAHGAQAFPGVLI